MKLRVDPRATRLARAISFAFATFVATHGASSRGDEVTYRIAGSEIDLTFEGTVKVNPGPIVSVKHGRFGSVNFLPGEVTFVRATPIEESLRRDVRGATALKDVAALLAVSRRALMAGRPDYFREALEGLARVAPEDPTVARLSKLAAAYDEDFKTWDEAAVARAAFGPEGPPPALRRGRSALYLAGDSGGSDAKRLAMRRLALMERVAQTYYFLLALDGVDVTLPDRPLVGVWCPTEADFETLRAKLAPTFAESTGFYVVDPGASIFFDQSTGKRFAPFVALAETFRREREEAISKRSPNLAEITRRAEATELVAKVAQERADVETLGHESIHQLLMHSGVLPAGSHPPRWLHEGLATCFEGYGPAGWAGPGSVLKERHARLLRLLDGAEAFSLESVVGDGPFARGSTIAPLDAYAYAWGVTHYLFLRRRTELFRFAAAVASESRDAPLAPERLGELLAQATGVDLATLDAEWRDHVRLLTPEAPAPVAPEG